MTAYTNTSRAADMATTSAPPMVRKNGQHTPTSPPQTVHTNPYSGKNWHAPKPHFTPSTSTSVSQNPSSAYAQRMAKTASVKATKAHEAELKAEKEAQRQRMVQAIKDKKEAKEERERWARMEEKMHRKRVERRRRREKRNKLLKS